MISFKHQAYVVVGGGRETTRAFICQSCENFLGGSLVGYPDWHEWVVSSFSIDEARELRAKQQRASFNAKKFFLVAADTLTLEAQNALLKTIEEPTANTFIFIAVPTGQNLLPTLLSRVEVVLPPVDQIWFSELLDRANGFLSADIPKKFELIEQIIGTGLPESDGTVRAGHPDRALARAFVGALGSAWRQKHSPEIWTADQAFIAEELIKAEQYLAEPASLAKMILEHLALILPVEKV